MRTIAFAVALTLFTHLCSAMDITVRDGTTYKRCEVTKIEADGIVINHFDGVARIPFENLPGTLQTQYHFDPVKVSQYRRRIAEAQAAAAQKSAEMSARSSEAALSAQKEREAQLQKQPGSEPTPPPSPAQPLTPEAQIRQLRNEKNPTAAPAPVPITKSALNQWTLLSQETQIIAVIVVLAAAAIGLAICVSVVNSIHRRRQWKVICADADKFLALLRESFALPTVSTDVILKNGERAFYYAPTSLYETRAVRYSMSGFAGFRVAKGVYIGGSSGRSVSNQELSKIDSGMLTVTNKRLIFHGHGADRTVLISKIVSVDSKRDSVEVSVENRQKSMLFEAENPLILCHIINLSCQGFDSTRTRTLNNMHVEE